MAKLYTVDTTSPDRAIGVRHLQITLKRTAGTLWRIDTIRAYFARRQHVLPKWLVRVGRHIKRTQVTLKYTGSDLWRVDSIRLKQSIKTQHPVGIR